MKTFQDEFNFLYKNMPTALYGNKSWHNGDENNPVDDNDLIEDYLKQIGKIKGFGNTIALTPGSEPDARVPFFSNIEELIEYLVNLILQSESRYGTADLALEIGEDCFGMYLPMHAFYKSEKTPWGIYLFPSLLKDRAIWLYEKFKDKYPELNLEDFVRLKVHGTFRHEVFHYQVERFATKLEILTRTPVYKPYNRIVKNQVRGTDDWLEEALAEAAVHKSRFIGSKTEMSKNFISKVLKVCSDNKAAGYRDYACKKFGGPEKAHLRFAAQIASQEINPILNSTPMASVKQEFISNGLEVPIYIYHHSDKKRASNPAEAII